MKIFEDFLLRNKIVHLNVKITDRSDYDIWIEAIDKINGEYSGSSETFHYGEDNSLIDIIIRYEFKYSDYRKIIRNLQTFDRTLKYDPKTRLTYIIISIKNSLQRREAA